MGRRASITIIMIKAKFTFSMVMNIDNFISLKMEPILKFLCKILKEKFIIFQ